MYCWGADVVGNSANSINYENDRQPMKERRHQITRDRHHISVAGEEEGLCLYVFLDSLP